MPALAKQTIAHEQKPSKVEAVKLHKYVSILDVFVYTVYFFLYLKFCNVPYSLKLKYIISIICSAQDNIKDIKNRAIVEQLNLLSKMQKYCYPLELNFNLIST